MAYFQFVLESAVAFSHQRAAAGYEAGQFLQTLHEDLDIQPHVPISAQRVTTPGPEGDARRRMLRRMKTRAYALSQRARPRRERDGLAAFPSN